MDSESLSYRFTPESRDDFNGILHYVSRVLCNPDAAKLFYDSLYEKVMLLCKIPGMGHKVTSDYLKQGNVKWIMVQNYILYYFVDETNKAVVILRIVHSRQDQRRIIAAITL